MPHVIKSSGSVRVEKIENNESGNGEKGRRTVEDRKFRDVRGRVWSESWKNLPLNGLLVNSYVDDDDPPFYILVCSNPKYKRKNARVLKTKRVTSLRG